MNRQTVFACLVVAVLAYWAGSASAPTRDRPILRLIVRAVAAYFAFRDEPPPEPANQARYVHLEPGAVDHRNAL